MTRAKYNAETNSLQELAGDKPNSNDFYKLAIAPGFGSFFDHNAYAIAWAKYNRAVNECRLIPCDPSCREVFKDQCEYEEGKDYEVRLHYHAPDDKELMAFPLSVKSEDDLHYEYAGKLAHCLGITISGADWEAKALPELKRLFSLTKR